MIPTTPVPAKDGIANPAPLGLSAFALTTFVLSLFNAGVINSDTKVIVVGLAMFYGGITQLLAGMWEFKAGNTFGATAFSSYGGFWLSFGAIFIPSFGIGTTFATVTNANDILHALGVYLLGWTIFTGLMLIAAHRTNGGLVTLFFFLFLTFIMLTAANFNGGSASLEKAGGALGVITAFIAWYNALSGLLTKENSLFTLPTFPLR